MEKVEQQEPVDTGLDFDDIEDDEIEDDEVVVLEDADNPEIPETPQSFETMLASYKEQSNNYVDLRLLKITRAMKKREEEVDTRFEQIESTLDAHAKLFKDIAEATPITVQQIPASIQQQQATAQAEQEHPTEKPNPVTGIVNGTLGTAGKLLHGVVDTAAFVLESVVDLVTLGKARRM